MYKVTEKDLKRWKKMADVITEYDEHTSQEVLSRVIEKLDFSSATKSLDGLVFISIRNRFYGMMESQKVERKRFKHFENSYKENNFELDDEYDVEADLDRQERLKLISECYDKEFDVFEKQLYYTHFIKGMNEYSIHKQTTISRKVLNKKIAEIKNKIKEYVSKNK